MDDGHDAIFLSSMKSVQDVYDEHYPAVHLVAAKRRGSEFEEGGVPSLVGLWRQMKELAPDVVVVRNPIYPKRTLEVAIARLTGSAVILYDQAPMHRKSAAWKSVILQLMCLLTKAKWITPVLGRADLYRPAFPALRYVPFVMEPQTTPEDKQWFGGGAINVMTVGRFEPRKNHRLFLYSISRLSDRYPVRATVIGECSTSEHDREYEAVNEFCQELGLADRVRIKKNLQSSEVQQEYSRHDLFVLPSRNETAAVSPLEAMSHSLPVICSDSNGTQCYIRPGENGYVFRTDDLDHLVDCMERIISDRERLKQMGVRSYELVLSEHSPSRYVETMVSIARGNG